LYTDDSRFSSIGHDAEALIDRISQISLVQEIARENAEFEV